MSSRMDSRPNAAAFLVKGFTLLDAYEAASGM